MEVRKLKAEDLKTLMKMLGKLSPEAKNEIVKILTGAKTEQGETDMMAIGISIFQILTEMTDDIFTWLADMIGSTPEELDNMSISTPIDIVKIIIAREDWRGFLSLAGS